MPELYLHVSLREGCTNENPEKVWHFVKTKIYPYFFLKIASLMAETNFTLGPISETIEFPFYYWPSFSQDSGPLGYFQNCSLNEVQGCKKAKYLTFYAKFNFDMLEKFFKITTSHY